VARTRGTIERTIKERGDPGLIFSGEVTVKIEKKVVSRPNILFVMIDDLGWMDLHVQGNDAVRTPNIDRFATEGMRFTDAYAAAPVCSPTRAAIMTGLSPARLHLTNHTPDEKRFTPENPKLLPAPMIQHLKAEYRTVAEELKDAGYATAFMGKWHLSGREDDQATREPQAQGFEINIGGCNFGGPPTFFDPYRIPHLEPRMAGEYLPERLADEAIDFLKQDRGEKPFFLCLWNYTVHWPMEAPEGLLKKYADFKGPGLNDSRYGAMIEGMDLAIGRVLKAVDDLQLRDDTLVIFTSDNGGYGGVADNRPLRGDKGHLYEGGIRIPLIVRWPGVVKAGSTSDVPVISTDWFPTLLEIAGAEAPKLSDGESLLPILRGDGKLKREALFFHYPNYAFHRSNRLGSAIRMGRHKLIERFDDGSLELFDLQNDLGEKHNLAEQYPDLAKDLAQRLRDWRASVGANMPVRP
jgi:arylsulfatase A-like enzyme